jgi:mono/diheme cytochrome c family protein
VGGARGDDTEPTPPFPAHLSELGDVEQLTPLTLGDGYTPYELNLAFWSDGAAKRRWLKLPEGKVLGFSAEGQWSIPLGTRFLKHFELDRPIETRVLEYLGDGKVRGATYRWRTDQTDGDRVDQAAVDPIKTSGGDQRWYFPSPDDCLKCHTPTAGGVLGISTRQLSRTIDLGAGSCNQLEHLAKHGRLDWRDEESQDLPSLTSPDDQSRSLEDRARSYLDVNCAMCHRPGGAPTELDCRWETPLAEQKLLGFPARINLGLDRARQIAPRDPWRSMVLVRMQATTQVRMPPLAHEQIDEDGVELIRSWILSLPGTDVVAPPALDPPGGEFREPVRVRLSHADPQAEIRYTLDGSSPTPQSPQYREPLPISTSTTLRARAFREGQSRSIVVSETYVVEP